MALVQTAVNFARVMAAVFANPLPSPVWTSLALRAGEFAAAVWTYVALRALVFAAAVLAPVALTAVVFAAVVLTLQAFLCRPRRQNFTHGCAAHVANILKLSACTYFEKTADAITALFAAPRGRRRTALLTLRRRRAASCRALRATAPQSARAR